MVLLSPVTDVLPAGIEATLATDSQAAPIEPAESAALTSLVADIDQRLARTLAELDVPLTRNTLPPGGKRAYIGYSRSVTKPGMGTG